MNSFSPQKDKSATLDRRAWLAAICCAAPLAACDAPGNEPPAFEDIDTNANGMISVVEAQQNDAVMSDFEQLDSNADGSLDKIEFGALTPKADVLENAEPLNNEPPSDY